MVETRIKPHLEKQASSERREEQRKLYRRNQTFGLLILALAILVWRLLHTRWDWLFPHGWWRP